MLPWYATRETVKRALDVKQTARNDEQVDRAIEASSRAVERDLRRRFYPQTATRTFAKPSLLTLFPVYEAGADLVSVASLTVNAAAVSAGEYDLLPVHGPPYSRIRFGGVVSFGTDRRPVSIAGVWGYDDEQQSAGTLAAAVGTTTETTVDTTDSSQTGVGTLLTVGAERLLVTHRAMVTTGQTLLTALPDQNAERAFDVADGTQIHIGEVLLVGAERLLVVDVAGTTIVVLRAFDGSVLDAHDPGESVFALRRHTVQRGAVGTTPTTHSQGAAVLVQVYPGPVVSYTVALALTQLVGETAGYTTDGDMQAGLGLEQVRGEARRAYRRLLVA